MSQPDHTQIACINCGLLSPAPTWDYRCKECFLGLLEDQIHLMKMVEQAEPDLYHWVVCDTCGWLCNENRFFWDTRHRKKCVECRRYEIYYNIEAVPGISPVPHMAPEGSWGTMRPGAV